MSVTCGNSPTSAPSEPGLTDAPESIPPDCGSAHQQKPSMLAYSLNRHSTRADFPQFFGLSAQEKVERTRHPSAQEKQLGEVIRCANCH